MYKKSLIKFPLIPITLIAIAYLLLTISSVTAATISNDKTLRVKVNSGNIQTGTCSSSGGHAGWPSSSMADVWNYDFAPGSVPTGSYTYAFTCFSDPGSNYSGGPITAYANLTMIPSNKVQVLFYDAGTPNPLEVSPTLTLNSSVSYAYEGDSYTLSWNYTDPYGTCTAAGSWTGAKSVSGTAYLYNNNTLSTDRSRTYSLSCTSPSSAGDTASVTVIQEADSGPSCPTCAIQ